ncbi:MAG: TIGR02444 family protein [Oceanicaulis sp.]
MSEEALGFWDFSLAVYGRPGVKEACLDLQSAGFDVNLALFICWAAFTGRDPAPALDEAIETSAIWSGRVVKPLRAARDALKPAPDFVDAEAAAALRKSILADELEAERLQQAALEPLAAACPAHGGDAQETADAALIAYGAAIGRPVRTGFVKTIFSAAKNV